VPIPTVPAFDSPAFTLDIPAPNQQPEWGVAPKLNFDQPGGQLLEFNSAGQFILASPMQSLEQLVVKAMITDRLMYAAYNRQFGSDFYTILGRSYSDLTIMGIAERFVREALSGIDLIHTIDQLVSEVQGDTLYIHFRVSTGTGQQQVFDFERVIA
jgi:Protein of unknown function (DUF2634)